MTDDHPFLAVVIAAAVIALAVYLYWKFIAKKKDDS